ncbi:nitric oxide synthase oxygenase [Nocardia sp. NPDC127579]|uniref:nitric oxide synthase oxygenase n=1 Tax=Nocardia sp. NPDC127579 TaxID=3345402 RepID=UPI003636A295
MDRRLRECEQFYRLPESAALGPSRRAAALAELGAFGAYRQTADEITLGARLAWRNADRCVGRAMWNGLTLFDARAVTTAGELAEKCWEYLESATNGGAIRPMIAVGPPRRPDRADFRIISPQLIRYAGYRNSDGTVTGDPDQLGVTELATSLGWHGAHTPFDLLPLLIRTPRGDIEWFEHPHGLVLEVPIRHPEFEWFADLGLKWHAVPAISNMTLEVGGMSYTVAFNGHYLGTEVGRDLTDSNRFNMLPLIGELMGLDQRRERTLWRDLALIEVNRAVLYSYDRAGVRIVDHHAVAKQFCLHVDRETAAGRACPTDWTWINPPISASLTPTFHRYYDAPDPDLRPAFLAAEPLDRR